MNYFKTIEYQSYNPQAGNQDAKLGAQPLAQTGELNGRPEDGQPTSDQLDTNSWIRIDSELTGERFERSVDSRLDISLEEKMESRTDDNEVNGQKINQTNSDFMRQRMNRPIDDQISKGRTQRQNCELAKLAQWSILNSIYRFTLKLKTLHSYQAIRTPDINSPDPADSKRSNSKATDSKATDSRGADSQAYDQFGHLQALLNETADGDLLQSASFDSDHLERLIRQSHSIGCRRCLERTNFLETKNLNRTIRLVSGVSDRLDNVADQLNELNRVASSGLRYQPARSITSAINSTSLENWSLHHIDSLQSALRKRIGPIKEAVLFGGDCTSGCDNSSSDSLGDSSNDPSSDSPGRSTYDLCSQLIRLLRSELAADTTGQTANRTLSSAGSVQRNERLVREPDESAAPEMSNYSYEICVEDWPNKNLERTFFIVANLVLNYLLPLVIISACYIAIWMTVWNRSVPCETTTASETPTLELPHQSCRLNYARKQIDQQSTASSSKSTKSLLVHTFSGFKNNLFPNSRSKHASVDNLNRNLVIQPGRSPKNQNLILKLRANAQSDGELKQCHLCSTELDSIGALAPGLDRYLPPTLAKNQLIKDELIKDELIKESIDRMEKKKGDKRSKAKKQAGQTKKSLLVCNYDQQPNRNQSANARQQIMITIDSSPTNSTLNSSNPAAGNEPASVYRRLRNRLRMLGGLLPGRRTDTRRRCVDLEAKNYELANSDRSKNGQTSVEENGCLKVAGNAKQFNGTHGVEVQIKQLINENRLMKQTENELDFEIEQIDEQLEESLERSSKQSSGEQPAPCRHRRAGNLKEDDEQLDRLMVKRALSKQWFSACTRCSNINNNCECKSHQPKQLIRSSKSTPISGTSDRLSIFGSRSAAPSRQRSSNRQHRLGQIGTGAQLNNRIEVILQRSRYKVAKMMVLIILAFFICWLPLYIIFTKLKLGLQFTSSAQLEERITFTLAPIAQWICYINSCLNPLVYGLNKKYRAEFKKLFKNVRLFRCLRSADTTNVKIKKGAKKPVKKNAKHNTSTRVLKTSLKSHPSKSASNERDPERLRNDERKCGDRPFDHVAGRQRVSDEERSSGERMDAERKRTLENVAKLPNNNFVPLPEEHLIKDQPKPTLNRSLSDLNLPNRKAALRRGASFSCSIVGS